MVSNGNGAPNGDNLYHIIFSASNSPKDVNEEVEKLRICGTFTDLKAAKVAAHKTLFEAGYEQEWFTEYDTQPQEFVEHNIKRRTGLCVYAVSPDKTIFRISVATTPNVQGFQAMGEDHKIHFDLYHVVQTNVEYSEDESGLARETNVEGSFKTYEEARKFASEVLLAPEDGVTKESFEQYDEAGPGDKDCGYGENVIVHAVGQNGENILVSVLKGQEMESKNIVWRAGATPSPGFEGIGNFNEYIPMSCIMVVHCIPFPTCEAKAGQRGFPGDQ
ncbi:hypothetical protein LTR96_009299 [Exophiala xenobiotica]|nr:hypothetical protein LTR92_009150 [Exophiala xenobiotica]KAK5231569.1 hypothetical protein LTR72_000752 [Exophiala xenobiotica]KAK5265396.1 hypothetical protein LTR96_009299 [Exophiala xenobiotica]KAK5288427.1 hypothetical protein LTR14_008286 [Exophiala xenobiotica]KAK5343944.1 hypothetical protein LTR98_001576 [Exophiala xenobiotica]